MLAHDGFFAGITLGLPLPVSTVWKFVSTPSEGAEVVGPGGVSVIVTVAVALVVQGVLAAGYLGSLREELAGADADFVAAVRRYFVPFVGFGLLLVALYVPPLVFALVEGPTAVLLLWIPLLFLVGYLLYAAPFLIVLDDAGLGSALSRCVSLATAEAAYFRYAVGYALLVAIVSVPTTLVTVNAGLAGVVVGAAALAPVALVFDATTLQFVSDLTDGASGDDPERGDGSDGWGTGSEWGGEGGDDAGGAGPS